MDGLPDVIGDLMARLNHISYNHRSPIIEQNKELAPAGFLARGPETDFKHQGFEDA